MTNPVIMWFRRDLRLSDNPALSQAVLSGKPVICLYIFETDNDRPMGAASQWWLHTSLKRLSSDLENIGAQLQIMKGLAGDCLHQTIAETGADHVVWNRRYSKDGIQRDKELKATLSTQRILTESFNGNLLTEPWEVKTKTGGYYKVFTPYWRAVRASLNVGPELDAPKSINAYTEPLKSLSINDLDLQPTHPDWGAKMKPFWIPGETGARDALNKFLSGPVDTYRTDRDRPDRQGTSRLSPHLAFGEISPRQIWHTSQKSGRAVDKFLSEIGWREFAYTLLFYNPDLAQENFKPYFDAFPWDEDDLALKRWQTGQTGYPFVDAGMRELWETGWQHNRVRMVTASFLIKHLLLDWRAGEAWFWDTLLDADPANNPAGWQWVAGSGADASPYFRIFNPFTQGEKFDPDGHYVRRWVPELSKLPKKYIHRPWEAPESVLSDAGVTLGETYPRPIVDHKFARDRALSAYKETKT